MAKRLMIVAAGVLGVLALAASATGTPSAASRSTALSAAPFAQAWANVPRTPAARQAKDVLVFGMEQDITGFNTGLTCCRAVLGCGRGQRARDARRVQHRQQASPRARPRREREGDEDYAHLHDPHGCELELGRASKLPVTYKDFAYTWQAFADPKNDVSNRAGTTRSRASRTRATSRSRSSGRSPMPTGRTSSAAIYPSQALAGLDFNRIWTNCLCGNDGKPVSDGPFSSRTTPRARA